VIRLVKAVARFCWDFVVGDDWRIAAGVVLVLALGAIALVAGIGGPWLPAAIAVALRHDQVDRLGDALIGRDAGAAQVFEPA